MSNENDTTRKLVIQRPADLRKTQFRANPATTRNLQTCADWYSSRAGRPIGISLIVRRALELLAWRLERAERKYVSDAELAGLMKHIR